MLALQAPRRLTAVTTNANQDQPPPDSANGLTHVDARGQANMVDVGAKPATARRMATRWSVSLSNSAYALIIFFLMFVFSSVQFVFVLLFFFCLVFFFFFFFLTPLGGGGGEARSKKKFRVLQI